jgi:aspartyl protease family protein
LAYIAKAGLAWVAIFAALFAVFSFRFEFIGIWERVKADISGAGGQSVSSEAIELRRQDDGHYWLMVDINGKPVRFMVDSGATMTAINATTAKEVGVEADGYPIILSTANGRVAAKRANVQSLTVGPHRIENHPVVVSERFAGQRLLARHRAVNAALCDPQGVLPFHSLSVATAKTPQEWQDSNAVPASPKCAGGDGRGMKL